MARKPYMKMKSLADCRLYYAGESKDKLADPDWSPCPYCLCTGTVKDKTYHDPVEGYKHAPRITCTNCNGTGGIDTKTFREEVWLNTHYRPWKKQYDLWKADEKIAKDILDNLSDIEKQALKDYFRNRYYD